MGSVPVTWSEINSWSVLRGIKLTQKELDIIRELDRIYWEPTDGR